MLTEKRKFNYVVLGLLAATIALWGTWIYQQGQIVSPF